ncbi:MAG TPA: maleylpyruvate isomerase N-terminal domain-containing protein [Candidatus Deferrimicrobium sp.]|nr:maleylpyruvate isomerase N-terminal domain-containing protein [Candidatus Deferrimicrobium sp.]
MPETTSPSVEIAGVLRAHASLLATIDGLTDAIARQPSLLPGWTVGHVLTHVARNADSVVRRLEGAVAGQVVDQYQGGAEGRQQGIEAGAGRPAGELLADVVRTSAAVERAVEGFPPRAWGRLTRSVGGDEVPASAVLFSRWREVEVHHVDLGLGYLPRDWPADLVERWLPQAREQFLPSADERDLLAWLVGRGPAPTLKSWG